MKYVILTYESASDFAAREDAALKAKYWAGWAAFGSTLKSAGIVSDMHGLKGIEMASTVRVRGGQKQIASGPFPGGDTQLGGYFIIDVDNEGAALDWAAKCPAAINGAVEVRPVF